MIREWWWRTFQESSFRKANSVASFLGARRATIRRWAKKHWVRSYWYYGELFVHKLDCEKLYEKHVRLFAAQAKRRLRTQVSAPPEPPVPTDEEANVC